MYNSLQLASRYFRYYVSGFNSKGHGMHSPFVFDFILNVLNNRKKYLAPPAVENLRKEMLQDRRLLQIQDLGAGSRTSQSQQKTVGQVARAAVKPKKYAHILYRLVRHYRPENIVELGTSLGITTSFLAMANPAARITTIEGSPEIFEVANENFRRLQLSHIRSLNGNFDDLLPQVLKTLPRVDLGYIDGNHRLEPTLDYFRQFLHHVHNHSILVFDDIHWSAEMETAWETIKKHPSVRCTLDIFFLGFVFFRPEFKEVQHFTIRR